MAVTDRERALEALSPPSEASFTPEEYRARVERITHSASRPRGHQTYADAANVIGSASIAATRPT